MKTTVTALALFVAVVLGNTAWTCLDSSNKYIDVCSSSGGTPVGVGVSFMARRFASASGADANG
ncbi:uncharacterized protein ColSpa_11178 [Colletotrichum spaethianum]|uniref:Uncharacterized protein n=1 Tax=Colletotrichum spaethianum TaxID=700344 RepID=A0AA37PF34_9PEZI|nr:uncharacterized protein ColSpa_11178 [Colletotrichum spaethianum]GKT50997.1 hypothetical protein ColSpa_11178 [Colletotrichum spaethianum]